MRTFLLQCLISPFGWLYFSASFLFVTSRFFDVSFHRCDFCLSGKPYCPLSALTQFIVSLLASVYFSSVLTGIVSVLLLFKSALLFVLSLILLRVFWHFICFIYLFPFLEILYAWFISYAFDAVSSHLLTSYINCCSNWYSLEIVIINCFLIPGISYILLTSVFIKHYIIEFQLNVTESTFLKSLISNVIWSSLASQAVNKNFSIVISLFTYTIWGLM